MRASTLTRLVLLLTVLGLSRAALAGNIGPDDRQVSLTGPPGSVESDAFSPAVAFDGVNQRYLAVWSADETDGDFRIFGQLLTGGSGAAVGGPFVISTASVPGTDHRQPAVAFDSAHQRYLVVWSTDGFSPGAYEIAGQAVDANGQLVGSMRRYSDMGTNDMDVVYDALTPDVAWHPGLGAFVVVWAGDDDTGLLSDDRFELYGQLVNDQTGNQVGANDFRISYAGPDENDNDAVKPSLAVTDDPQRWYVAFEGDITDDGVHDSEIWVYGGTGDVPDPAATQLSLMGGGFDDGLTARNPDLVWVPDNGELVCVWDGQESVGSARAIYAQRLFPDGTTVGGRIDLSGSVMVPGGTLRESVEPAVAFDPIHASWFVTWRGDILDAIQYDHEIWGAGFTTDGLPVDGVGHMLSDMDPLLDPIAGAGAPAVAVNGLHGYKLILWSGDLASTPGGENEIFVQAWAEDGTTAADDPPIALSFRLHPAVPNPFNPQTTIAFDLPSDDVVSLRVYDAAGRVVRTLLAESPGRAGRNEIVWNGRDDAGRQAAAGVYLYRLDAKSGQDLGRMVLVK